MAVGQTGYKEAKYTQAFSFQHDEAGQDRSRQVVERACTAVATLMQEVFAQIEKQVFQQLKLAGLSLAQQRSLEQLSEIVRARPIVERAVLSSVLCAFARLEDEARDNNANAVAIDQQLSFFRDKAYEPLDLLTLLGVSDCLAHCNNSNRPLLVHLNAQLAICFNYRASRLRNSPLAPATLMGGVVAALLCAPADIAAKKLLFTVFQQECLARFPVLLNSVTLRLESEGVSITHPVAFDENDWGPMGDILGLCRHQETSDLERQLQILESSLKQQSAFLAIPQQTATRLGDILSRRGEQGYVETLSDLRFIKRRLEPVFWRASVCEEENRRLQTARRQVAEYLHQQWHAASLPVFLQDFLQQHWSEVLFETALVHGVDSGAWRDLHELMQDLARSIRPLENEEQKVELTRLVPRLVKHLREYLEEAGYGTAETTPFFQQLKQLHLANLQQDLSAITMAPWREDHKATAVLEELAIANTADQRFFNQVRTLVGE